MTALPACIHCGSSEWPKERRSSADLTHTWIDGGWKPLHSRCEVAYFAAHKNLRRRTEQPKVTNTAKPYRGSGTR